MREEIKEEKTTLYVVATPIGNLEDITLRALRVLKEVDLILCEDTRVTKKLLAHYDIETPTLSYHARSGAMKIEKIISLLKQGQNIALVADAGTPSVSDPGAMLVGAVRGFFEDAVAIVPIPGASALTTALSVAGIADTDFLFLGFLPHKKGRETLFREIALSERTVVFYESPHRILRTLVSLIEHTGSRNLTIARELTKYFEEIKTATPEAMKRYLEENPQAQKGEFVVIISPTN